MEQSTNWLFNLPNSSKDEVADVDKISDNFRIIDSVMKATDQTYNPDSTNAASGKAIKEAIGELKPIPDVDQIYNGASENPQSGKAIASVIDGITSAVNVATNEIYDARVDNFGTTHATLGESVRFMSQDLDKRKAEKQEVANALKGTASGSVLALNDVSPVEHTMGVKVSSKNLFDYSGVNFTKPSSPSTYVKENNGFTFTAGTGASHYFYTKNISAFHLKPNTTYTSKATVTLTDNGSTNIIEAGSMSLSLLLQTNSTFDSSGKGKIYIVNGSKNGVGTHEIITTFTTPADMTDFQYVVTRLSNNTTVIFKDIQIELGTTATDYTPYISDVTAIPEPYINYFFNHHCVFPSGGGETYWAPIYIDKTFEPVEGKTYYVEISDSVTTMPGYDTTGTCTATANGIGGYTMELSGTIRIETCSEGHGETWTSSFRITYLAAPDIADFNLKIGEDGYITKPVKLTKTNADGTVSEEYTPTADGTVNGVTSLYPCTKLSTDVDGIVIECEYNRDINKAFAELQAAIISLGGNV